MLATRALTWALVALRVAAQDDSSTSSRTDEGTGSAITLTGTNSADVTRDGGGFVAVTTGVTYASDGETITYTSTSSIPRPTDLSSALASATNGTSTTGNSTSATQTLLVGGTATMSSNATSSGTSTSSSVQPTNTVPCNGYPEFCERSYGNITQIAAHNSPFVRPGNLASNQDLEVRSQLNDGVRMLQFQVHYQEGAMLLCHSDCNMLNVGPLEDYLRTVYEWMQDNPYDVITILMGNFDMVDPQSFVAPVQNSGLLKYAYIPPTRPMGLDEWPTLGEMLLRQQRVVFMLDYQANQDEIPWLLDEFSYMWETPFSPTERDFPCTVQRPPDQSRNTSANRLYMANHNLNLEVAIAGISLLIPASNFLNETNAIEGFGSAGVAVENCTADWDRPPNFVLVDYYNIGSFNGSVFQVAATANDVPYDRDSCCDTDQRSFRSGAVAILPHPGLIVFILVLGTFAGL